MKTTKITLTILTIILMVIILTTSITKTELNSDIKSINTVNDIATITLRTGDKVFYDNLNGEYWSNDIKVIDVEPTDNNSFKISLSNGSYLISKGLEYKYYR